MNRVKRDITACWHVPKFFIFLVPQKTLLDRNLSDGLRDEQVCKKPMQKSLKKEKYSCLMSIPIISIQSRQLMVAFNFVVSGKHKFE